MGQEYKSQTIFLTYPLAISTDEVTMFHKTRLLIIINIILLNNIMFPEKSVAQIAYSPQLEESCGGYTKSRNLNEFKKKKLISWIGKPSKSLADKLNSPLKDFLGKNQSSKKSFTISTKRLAETRPGWFSVGPTIFDSFDYYIEYAPNSTDESPYYIYTRFRDSISAGDIGSSPKYVEFPFLDKKIKINLLDDNVISHDNVTGGTGSPGTTITYHSVSQYRFLKYSISVDDFNFIATQDPKSYIRGESESFNKIKEGCSLYIFPYEFSLMKEAMEKNKTK